MLIRCSLIVSFQSLNISPMFSVVAWKGTHSGSQASRVVLRFNRHLKVLEKVPMITPIAHGPSRQPILSSNIAAHANGSCLLGFHPLFFAFQFDEKCFLIAFELFYLILRKF